MVYNIDNLLILAEHPNNAQTFDEVKTILGRYDCPHSFKCRFKRGGKVAQCPFHHPMNELEDLRPDLPNYVCVSFLLNKCVRPLMSDDNLPQNLCMTCVDVNGKQCRNGLHITPAELASGFENNPDNQRLIAAFITANINANYICKLCDVNIHLDRRAPEEKEFAILKGCDHVHCARCMRWRRLTNLQCTENCSGSDKVFYVHYESILTDRFLKEAIFSAINPSEPLPFFTNRSNIDVAYLMEPFQDIKNIYARLGLGLPPREPIEFSFSLKENLDNDELAKFWQNRIIAFSYLAQIFD